MPLINSHKGKTITENKYRPTIIKQNFRITPSGSITFISISTKTQNKKLIITPFKNAPPKQYSKPNMS